MYYNLKDALLLIVWFTVVYLSVIACVLGPVYLIGHMKMSVNSICLSLFISLFCFSAIVALVWCMSCITLLYIILDSIILQYQYNL